MKAIINHATNTPCDITSVSDYEVSFKITKDIATADNLNALLFMKARLYEFSTEISVDIARESVVSIHFVN